VRRLTDRLHRLVGRGDAGRGEAAQAAAQLWAARDRWRSRFPGGDAEVDALLEGLAARVAAIYDAEAAAVAGLGRALERP
jgi:hypothetical protein